MKMKNGKFKLKLYFIAVKWRLILYLIAGLTLFIPILIVLLTDTALSNFYGNLFINTSIAVTIMGKILTVYKKTIENKEIPWGSIGTIVGLLIVLVGSILR